MNKNLETAVETAGKIGKLKGVLQVILFGSVAKGEDTAKSDIDLAVIHNLRNPEKLKSQINQMIPGKVQIVYATPEKLSKEIELVSALTGEGLLLFGRPLQVYLNKKELKPFIIMVYETSDLDNKQRMLLNRALYGSVSESQYGDKRYKSELKGIVNRPGIKKLAKACLLIESGKAGVVRNTIKRFKAKFQEELFWK